MVWNGISRKASRSFWIFARSRLRMDSVGANDHLPGYLIRPSVKAEGSPKEAESIVGRTKSTPWETKCDFYFQCIPLVSLEGVSSILVQAEFLCQANESPIQVLEGAQDPRRESCQSHLCDEEVKSLVQQRVVPRLLPNSPCDVIHLNRFHDSCTSADSQHFSGSVDCFVRSFIRDLMSQSETLDKGTYR